MLVEPAIKLLQGKGADIRFGHELREFVIIGGQVSGLNFGDDDHRDRRQMTSW